MSASLPSWTGEERASRLALSRIVDPGDEVAEALLAALDFGDAVRVLIGEGPLPARLVTSGRARQRLEQARQRWRSRLPGLDPDREMDRLTLVGARLLIPGDEEWPPGLGALGSRAPLCLYVRGGDLAGAVRRSVALVGSRACTDYGRRVAADLAASLAASGVGVVSGGAYGIDGEAHAACLAAGGTTVAVLACGVDRFYPRGHERLLGAVAASGALVSEVPLGGVPARWRFLQRNRLIAALTQVTVVVEAAWRSGALSTAHHAATLGRPVGAVPGPITSPASAGCHRLLREVAATCVTDAAEVLELLTALDALPLTPPTGPDEHADGVLDGSLARAHDGLGACDLRVLDSLAVRRVAGAQALAAAAGLDLDETEAGLGRLSLRGLAERVPGGWRRARPAPSPSRATGS